MLCCADLGGSLVLESTQVLGYFLLNISSTTTTLSPSQVLDGYLLQLPPVRGGERHGELGQGGPHLQVPPRHLRPRHLLVNLLVILLVISADVLVKL